jgi:serine/threonine protein kinase
MNYTGFSLKDYRFIKLLGKGSSEEVYLAEHMYLQTYVAIKMQKARLDVASQQRFLSEAKIVAHLDHPHIVPILGFTISKGRAYLIMRYASGGSLRTQYPRGHRLSPDRILQYLYPLSDALIYIHDRNLVHQDIKPENILLDYNDNVFLSDFGIAKKMSRSHTQKVEKIAGTIAYMAPERFQGLAFATSDQYALAVMVYECLAGEQPFRGSIKDIEWQHIYARPPALTDRFPGIPREIEQVVFRALEKNPSRRFEDVSSFVFAFDQAVAHSHVNDKAYDI